MTAHRKIPEPVLWIGGVILALAFGIGGAVLFSGLSLRWLLMLAAAAIVPHVLALWALARFEFPLSGKVLLLLTEVILVGGTILWGVLDPAGAKVFNGEVLVYAALFQPIGVAVGLLLAFATKLMAYLDKRVVERERKVRAEASIR